MEIPKFNETFIPILEVLSNGEVLHHRKLIQRVESEFYSELSDNLKHQLTKSGERLIENRIAWGKSYLKKGGLVHYPKRGFVQITDQGKNVRKEKLHERGGFEQQLIETVLRPECISKLPR